MCRQLVLYTGTYCHLCNDARDLIFAVLPPGVRVIEVNIDDDQQLKERYGLRIPVFAILDQRGAILAEKGWPFSGGQIKKMLAGSGV